MLFLNPWLLLGLAGIAIPVILHLLNRHRARRVDWGAMRFLLDSLVQRRRRLLLEEMLLLATRCLLAGLAALALARPFIKSHAAVPWLLALPAALLAIVAFSVSFALWSYPFWRRRLLLAALFLGLLATAAVLSEGWIGWRRFGRGAARDVAIVLDGSSSMTLQVAGQSNFERAVGEAEDYIREAPRNVACALLVGGAAPQVLTPAPVTDRRHLLRLLDNAVPAHGTMQALDTLAAAAVSLAQGANGVKQILLIGDGQSTGWNLGEQEPWSYLRQVFGRFPGGRPQVVWRTLDLPAGIRNLTVADVAFSRQVIGTDREVRIDVRVDNNGREAVTAQGLHLAAEDRRYSDHSIGQLPPGESCTVSFRHRFQRPGTRAVVATLDVADEMEADNVAMRVAAVRGWLRVLIAEGGGGRRLEERPGMFLALGLAPGEAPPADAEERRAARPSAFAGTRSRSLVRPELIAADELDAREAFDPYGVIALADVPRLSPESARRLERFVRRGGGLLVIHGGHAEAGFFNAWTGEDGEPLLPLKLVEPVAAGATAQTAAPAPSTFTHPAIRELAAASDLESVVIESYWRAAEHGPAARVGGRLINGDPFLAERSLGRGTIVQVAAAFDPRSGNLVSRQVFVPLVHELVYHLARPVAPDLNIPPMRGATLALGGDPAAAEGEAAVGLRGIYRAGADRGYPLLIRRDPQINFDWGTGSPDPAVPPDNFNVVWAGSLRVPRPGRYRLFGQADDAMTITLGTPGEGAGGGPAPEVQAELDAARRHDLRVEYCERTGRASAVLMWEGPGIPAQPVPAQQLSPLPARGDGGTPPIEVTVHPPAGTPFAASLRQTRDGFALHLPPALTPGLHEVEVPPAAAPFLAELATVTNGSETARFVFCVATDGRESRMDTVTEADVAFIRRHIDLVVAENAEDARRALAGAAIGRELWRAPALAVLLLLVLEIALTRWIAIQRRTGEEGSVSFEEAGHPGARFREQLAAVRGAESAFPPGSEAP
jgi:hypothetical protein